MNDSDLDSMLRTWRVPEVSADRFRRGVWERIAQADAATPLFLRWFDILLRPRVAFAALLVAVVAGSAGGTAHAAWKSQVAPLTVAEGTAAYVQSINPLDPIHLRASHVPP